MALKPPVIYDAGLNQHGPIDAADTLELNAAQTTALTTSLDHHTAAEIQAGVATDKIISVDKLSTAFNAGLAYRIVVSKPGNAGNFTTTDAAAAAIRASVTGDGAGNGVTSIVSGNGSSSALFGQVSGTGGGSAVYANVSGPGSGHGVTSLVTGGGSGFGMFTQVTGVGTGTAIYADISSSGNGHGVHALITGNGNGHGVHSVVTGNGNGSALFAQTSGTGTGTGSAAYISTGAFGTRLAALEVVSGASSTYAAHFTGAVLGTVGFTTSDRRLKTNINPLTDRQSKGAFGLGVYSFNKLNSVETIERQRKAELVSLNSEEVEEEKEIDAAEDKKAARAKKKDAVAARKSIRAKLTAKITDDDRQIMFGGKPFVTYGVIAQDVQEVAPQLVHVGPDGMLTVNEVGLLFSMIAGAQAEIAELKAIIKSKAK